MTILTEVNEIEGKVVDTVRSMQRPVVDCVRKGVELADGLLPKLPYPESLPKPGEVVSSQIDFAKALLDAQRDFVGQILEAVAPLVKAPGSERPTTSVTADATAPAEAEDVAQVAEPAPKTTATPAAKAATKRPTTRKTTRSPKA